MLSVLTKDFCLLEIGAAAYNIYNSIEESNATTMSTLLGSLPPLSFFSFSIDRIKQLQTVKYLQCIEELNAIMVSKLLGSWPRLSFLKSSTE